MVDSTDTATIKVSSGNGDVLREGTQYWQSANRDAGEAWVELAAPTGRVISAVQVRLPRAGEPDGVDTFTPEHVVIHIAEEGEAQLRDWPHWESKRFWALGQIGEFFAVNTDFPARTTRVRLSIKRTASCGLNTRIQALKVVTRRLKRAREDSITGRLWADTDFVDCSIFAEDGQEMRVHRVVLASASPVFARMLAAPMQENSERVVRLRACFNVVRAVVRYCYGQPSERTLALQEQLSLVEQAHFLQLTGLCEEIASGLIQLLSRETVVPIIRGLRTFYKEGALEDEWASLVAQVRASQELSEAFFLDG